MPKVLRRNLPPQLYAHLPFSGLYPSAACSESPFSSSGLALSSNDISRETSLPLMVDWLDTQPEVPIGRWFKRFPGMIVCGENELVKTFLVQGQIPTGEEIH